MEKHEGLELPKLMLTGIVLTGVGVCTCGEGIPVVLTLMPGAQKWTTCTGCRTMYRPVLLGYTESEPDKIQFGVSVKHPDVIIPAGNLKVV